MKLRSGIKLLNEIVGYGDPIKDSEVYDAVIKFYRNKGEPLMFEAPLHEPVPVIVEAEGKPMIGWSAAMTHRSNVAFDRARILARQQDMLPGIYYSILGMRQMGYRHAVIPPHLLAHSMHTVWGIDRESVIKLEVFLLAIRRAPPVVRTPGLFQRLINRILP
jgi:hypothetical protein